MSSNSTTTPSTSTFSALSLALLGGAVAGFSEHSVMYPIDTVKTRIQVGHEYRSVWTACRQISQTEGISALYRGLPAVLLASVPSHGAYFTALEATRMMFNDKEEGKHRPMVHAISGAAGTIAHDFIVTPLDVVKQRMQMSGKYSGSWECFRDILKEGKGVRTLLASYPTTLLMNVPFMALFVSVYESVKLEMTRNNIVQGTPQHLISAGFAGAISGLLTTPLDVIKTRIQTRGVSSGISSALFEAGRSIYRESGYSGFIRGGGARAVYFMPSAAIVWGTYEFVKEVFGIELEDHDHVPI